MAQSAVELDFFRMEKESSTKSQAQKLFDRRRSFRGFQNVISKLSPELLQSLTASSYVNNGNILASRKSISVPSTPKDDSNFIPALPVYTPIFGSSVGSESTSETSPMTIFYNGIVAVFDVPQHKAESILKLAQEGGSKAVESSGSTLAVPSSDQRQLLETLNGDLPIARKKSLQRFMEKRKKRLTLVSPYGCPNPNEYAFSAQKTLGSY